MKKTTPGKLQGLERISTPEGFFLIAALDHRDSLKRMLDPTGRSDVKDEMIVNIKTELVKNLALHSSAVLLDPEYGILASSEEMRGHAGLIMSIEKSGYSEKGGSRKTALLDNWSVLKTKEAKADAVKLLVYYRPDLKEDETQLELVKKVSEDCVENDIAFVCEPFVYALKDEKGFDEKLGGLVVETVGRMSGLGMDVLKIQFPGNVGLENEEDLKRRCEELDASCKVPWVLLSGGCDYHDYLKQVEIAASCGSSGIMVGRALWQEAFKKGASIDDIVEFVREVSIDRLEILSEVAKRGLPWTDRVPSH